MSRPDPDTIRRHRSEALEREERGRRSITLPFSTKVVGVTFAPGYPANLLALADLPDGAAGEAIELVRRPDNAVDPNAIEVHVPVLGDNSMVGHLTGPIAARLAPDLDAGIGWTATVEEARVDPEHASNPGISIRCAPARKEQ